MTPRYLLFAGVNGAGKSTLYKSGLWTKTLDDMNLPRVNTDEILVSHGWDWADSSAQLKAGKEAVALIRQYFSQRVSFNQETTLSGRSIVKNVRRAKKLGYDIHLNYVGLSSPELANERIAHRVMIGGHDIDAERVERRYRDSLQNLLHVAQLCDSLSLYDNTYTMRFVAGFSGVMFSECWYGNEDITWCKEIVESLHEIFLNRQ